MERMMGPSTLLKKNLVISSDYSNFQFLGTCIFYFLNIFYPTVKSEFYWYDDISVPSKNAQG